MQSQHEYEQFVRREWGKADDALRELFIMVTGLAGETGEVCELIKKDVRGRSGHELDPRKLLLELGDVQNYLTRIAQRYGFTLAQVQSANIAKLESRRVFGKSEVHELLMAEHFLAGAHG